MSANQLRHITIRGFKSIRELETFEIQPLNILIGGNGAGKSNFVQVFELLHEVERERLGAYSLQEGVDKLLFYGRKYTDTIELKLTFVESPTKPHLENGYHAKLVPTQNDSLIFEDETVLFHDTNKYSTAYDDWLGTGHPETRLKSTKIGKRVLRAMSTWRIYHFHDTSDESPMKRSHDLHQNHYLAADGSNLAAFLYLLQEKYPASYQQIEQVTRLAMPFFDRFVLQPQQLAQEKIRLEWRDKSAYDTVFSAHDLSDGTLRFIALATLLLQPDDTLPGVILIDEPELGLHPYAIVLLAELLVDASRRSQVIVSTQSVPLVNQFSPEAVIAVDRKDRQSTFQRLDPDALAHWLDEYGVGDLWEKNIIGGRPQAEF
jgi:predicted ATPase